jgi:hypothetical protein
VIIQHLKDSFSVSGIGIFETELLYNALV